MTDDLPERVGAIEHKLDALSVSVYRRFAEVDRRFDEVDRRFGEVDRRFDEVTAAFVEQRQYTEFAFERLRGEMVAGFDRLDQGIDRLERVVVTTGEQVGRIEVKLDRFIAAFPMPVPRRRSPRAPKKR